MADRKQEAVQRFDPARRRPEMDRRWSKEVEDVVLEIISKTGSPKQAAEAVGIGASTIHDHRRRDPEFRHRYAVAMDDAFNAVLGHAFTRSFDEVRPSDRLTEVLLRLRWPERLGQFLQMSGGNGQGGGLDPMVIGRMPSEDRTALIALLEKYQEVAGDVALEVQTHDLALLD
ncbi:MAG: hypothetical protein FD175_238 [Beijerinckiaceae bacterium]|nr:MAG: hypothetical protein FD175_238 [Beijerinckiaceae bacterium]